MNIARALRLFVLLLAAALLAGCGMFQRDTTEPPAPLPDFEAKIAPSTVWDRNTGSGTGRYYVHLEPMLHEDALYVTDADGQVTAVALEDGRPRWSTDLDVAVTGGVGGGEGIVAIGTAKGEAIALDMESGELLWRRQLSSEVMALSTVQQNRLIARTNDGRVHALDAGTGEPAWLAGRTTPALSLRGVSQPVMVPGRVVVGFDNGRVVVLGLSRGNALWETVLAMPSGRSELERMVDVDGHIEVRDGRVYAVAYQGRVAALSLSDGRTLWDREFSSYRGLAVSDDQIFITDAEDHVWALDREGGATLWQQDQLRLRRLTPPVVFGDHVVLGDYQGYLHWLDREDGSLVGRLQVDSSGVMARPIVHEDRLYVLGQGGRLAAVVPEGGRRGRWAATND
ncbi:outer membrane protein assembly factor BamB [Thioalkalivibrio denitrificans]|uniref:Outer membrane protein assembly factor BamB n=1 Tax=Thioalkalivibrio denitrificans TaxID=108003 RepID=A0A1V3N743_9GAMM|nr:outer membrane protein assembly factor BamB [Thioalkalivibrio denitrificans]OOG20793.1 outer membrane protein assembly factor BamB [Thioalkalivibrio denitrificans]